MSTIIFAVLAFVLGCLTVLAPRPIVRTGFLSWFLALIFVALHSPMVAGTLAVLAGVLLVIDLCFYREPKPVGDIGDRQTTSATVKEPQPDDRAIRLLARLLPFADRGAFYMRKAGEGDLNAEVVNGLARIPPRIEAICDEAIVYLTEAADARDARAQADAELRDFLRGAP
jgi:hypothetical protein